MSDILYRLQGVDLIDQRWANSPAVTDFGPREGAWELLQGTSLLPNLPGFDVTTFRRPGQQGESRVQHAPVNPRGIPLSVRFYAVDPDGATPTYGMEGTDVPERVHFLEKAVSEFLFRTQLGKSGSGGDLQLERRYTANGGRMYTTGMVRGSVEPEYGPDYRYADYHFIFTSGIGTWYTLPWQYVSATVPGGESTEVDVPMGTAAVPDARIAYRGVNGGDVPGGTRFLNEMRIGVMAGPDVSGNTWRVIDVDRRGASAGGSGAQPNWNGAFTNTRFVHEHGRPLGTGLLIQPGVAGDSRRIGTVIVEPTADIELRIAVRPRYF